MTTHTTATVLGGMLKTDDVLPLADHTRVRLTIEPISADAEPTAAWEALKARLGQRPINSPGQTIHSRPIA